ncbi:hypothetical protein AY599_28070 [Leptolyngbya valderiana BDU 20041]|nr:hypothetical protein AY599_28070 [Leptolyngbya valderiana BDU 20041]
MTLLRLTAPCVAILASVGCSTPDGPQALDWMTLQAPVLDDAGADEAASGQDVSALETAPRAEREPPMVTRERVPSVSNRGGVRPGMAGEMPELVGDPVNATLAPQPLPAFINTVFGEILQQPFTMGPNVADRDEIISLRSVNDLAPDTFLTLVEQALSDYGLAVLYEEGLFRVVERAELRAQMPQFIRSRAQASVPDGLRPVVQFVELTAIDSADMAQILEQAFPGRDVLSVNSNRRLNTLTISGLADDVNAALALIEEMDELRFAGTQFVTVDIQNWAPSELAAAMDDILTLQGYMVAVGVSAPRAITLLPLDYTNQMMIFAFDRPLADQALALAIRLDREAYDAEVETAHVYQAQNTEAQALAQVVAGVLGRTSARASDSRSSQSGGTGQQGGGNDQRRSGDSDGSEATSFGNITVDEQGNRVIFKGTRAEYDQFVALARQLDTPVPEVMIEVTIAEVTLTDDTTYGLDIIFDSDIAPRFGASLSSQGSFSGTLDTGEVTLEASATANNSQVNVLSTPRIVTRSGTEASVQVGTDVPIITSQRAADTQSGGSSDILQTVQYRSTGILLSVEPRVYSNNRIDLTINQETSAAEANSSSGISSPLISTRTLSSQLSLQDGQTAVLGGLIENRLTRGNSGIPLLKDIPVIGSPFRNENMNATRTMLVVLVTPYVLDTRNDRQQVVDSLVRTLNDGFRNQTRPNSTLLSPREPMEIRPAGSIAEPAPEAR